MALGGKLLDPGAPHGHQGELGGDEKAVGQDQQDDGQQSAGDVETGWIVHGCGVRPQLAPATILHPATGLCSPPVFLTVGGRVPVYSALRHCGVLPVLCAPKREGVKRREVL